MSARIIFSIILFITSIIFLVLWLWEAYGGIIRAKLPGESCSVNKTDDTSNCGEGLECTEDPDDDKRTICSVPSAEAVNCPTLTSWKCKPWNWRGKNKGYIKVRKDLNGDMTCASTDAKDCKYWTSESDCTSSPDSDTKRSLACGNHHLALFGVTGYDYGDEVHWCKF